MTTKGFFIRSLIAMAVYLVIAGMFISVDWRIFVCVTGLIAVNNYNVKLEQKYEAQKLLSSLGDK